jgi:hypothetical protein
MAWPINSNSITSHALRAMSAGTRQRRHRDSVSCRIIAGRIADSLLNAEQKKSAEPESGGFREIVIAGH